MVTVLAFDCAGSGCAAAVVAGGRVIGRRAQAMEHGQAEALLPLIAATMAAARTEFTDLDVLAVTVGPGSFTGLRIGLATARGLGLATGLPLVGVTSFAAVAAAVPTERRRGRPLIVALESRRAEFYLQWFGADGLPRMAGALVPPDAAAAALPPGPLLLAGDAAARLQPLLSDRATCVDGAERPDPADIAHLALAAWRPGERPAPVRPLYLRAPDTTLPRRQKAAP